MGFLNDKGEHQQVKDKFLLGLTADPFKLKRVFGGGDYIAGHGLKWFMDRGYLHKVKALPPIFYGEDVHLNTVRIGEETVSVADDPDSEFDPQSRDVANAIKTNFDGKKVLVFTISIKHAQNHERALNAMFGEGYARAIYNGMSGRAEDIVKEYAEGKGPKVLISIEVLSHGFRAHGTDAILFDYQTDSIRRYGQQFGRALGVQTGEKQREITIAQMVGRSRLFKHFVDINRFIDMRDRIGSDLFERSDLHVRSGGKDQRHRPLRPVLNNRRGIVYEPTTDQGRFQRTEGRLQKIMRKALSKRYNGDLLEMAGQLGIDSDAADSYVYGALPKTMSAVAELADALGFQREELVSLWEEDALEAIEFLYPTPGRYSETVREFIKMVRLTTLHLSGLDSVSGTLQMVGINDFGTYQVWKNFFNARPGRSNHRAQIRQGTIATIQDILVRAKVVESSLVQFTAEETLQELLSAKDNDPVNKMEVPAGLLQDVISGKRKHDKNREGFLELHGSVDNALYMYLQNPFEVMFAGGLAMVIDELLDTLEPRKAQSLRLRFGVGDYFNSEGECVRLREPKTLDETAPIIAVTRERVRQIEAKALVQLGRSPRVTNLEEFYNHNPLLKELRKGDKKVWRKIKPKDEKKKPEPKAPGAQH